MRRPVSTDWMARRSPACSMAGRVEARRPGAGSRYWVRSSWRLRSMRRYRASSAWQRRQDSMWRWTGRATGRLAATASGGSRAISSHRTLGPSGVDAVVEQVAEPFAGPVEPDLGCRDGDAGLVGDGLV